MIIRSEARRRRSTAENGFVLVVVIFMLAILVLSLAVAAPRIKQALQRDREVEAIHRGKQYVRAVQLYYRKFHAYPPNLDALEKTDNVRFLRKRYIDPITGKDDWTPILFGQNKVPTTMGFFGQPLAITSVAGTGPGGTGSGSSVSGSSAISNEDPVAGGASPDSTGGQTLGGAGIIGFSIPSAKQSILVYKKQDHFNKWEFVYDPIQDSGLNRGGGGGATAGGNAGTLGSTNGNQPVPGGSGIGTQPTNGPWGPNGNLPAPGGPGSGTPPNGPWGPNGNLPTPPPQ
jgi:type II secretory pathway pseudopilin PulG